MKWLFILLLLVNVLYLGWELDREAGMNVRSSGTALNIPASAQRLQLISELQAPPVARSQVVADTGDTEPTIIRTTSEELVAELPEIILQDDENMVSPMHCYRYGPIPDEVVVKELHQWFQARDIVAKIQYTEEESSQMYWIYLTPQQSREGALAIIQEMEDKGIGDYRLINRGDLENAISLGLYSSRQAVTTRLEELNQQGYVPVVVPYSDVNRIFWLDTGIASGQLQSGELENELPGRYESVSVNCNDISGL